MHTNDVINELGTNFIEYAVAVNTDRAIPNAADGLKPVAKRILYGAFDSGYKSTKSHVKCANIVGNVMAYWHPHGDSSIYGALVRLSQPWVMRYPLIDFHGANGNIGGDGPAAYRYTEARLSKLVEEGMLATIKKDTVDFIPNYSETKDEPVSLPAIFPNLLCNPNTGIGVAMACNWLPHNLNEVAQAIYDYMDGKDFSIPGPDFPTGGLIINGNDLPGIIKNGHGSVKVRGKYIIEKNTIVFTEIPYGQTIEGLLDEIGELAENKLPQIIEIRNESNKKGLRIAIECDKNANLEYIVNQLFKETNLQTSISYNQVALIDKTPTELGLKDCLKIYVDYNSNCIVREADFDIKKTQNRLHIVIGLIKALDIIDDIIAEIKASDSSAKAKIALMESWHFSEEQAKAILDMKLARLSKLDKEELETEKVELEQLLEVLNGIKNNPIAEVRKRLAEIVKDYGDARRTEITNIVETKEEKEIVAVEPEKCVVVMTETGLIKRIPVASFKTQHRNGVGVKTQNDIISGIIRTNTVDHLMIFTNKGKMYRLLVDTIPVGTNISHGVSVQSLVSMDADEVPTVIYSIYRDTDAKYVCFITKKGLVKKTSLDELLKVKKKTGIATIKLKPDDSLASVFLIKDEPILICSKNGYILNFDSEDIAPSGRNTMGIKGISLKEDDTVAVALPVHNMKDEVALFFEGGTAKRLAMPTIQNRAGKGTQTYKETEKSGKLQTAVLVNDNDKLFIMGRKKSLCINAKDIPTIASKISTGNPVIKDEFIQNVSKI